MSHPVTRRRALALGAAAGVSALSAMTAVGLKPAVAGEAVGTLTLYGAPIGVSLPLAHVVDRNALQPAVANTGLTIWRSPDEMRAGVAAGWIEVTTSPAPAAANLYNRGTGMRLAAVLTTGMLYLMTAEEGITRIEDLTGKKVLVPFRGDMPDRVFQLLLEEAGMTADDIGIEYVATPREAAQLLVAGQAPAAVLQEPAATMAMMRGMSQSVRVHRAVNLQTAFGAATGRGTDIPMAVLIVRDSIRERVPDLPALLVSQLKHSTGWVNNNAASAARLGEDYMGLRAPVLERSIPHMNLSVRTPSEIRDHLEFFYGMLARQSPRLLGGRLPDSGFYLDVG